MQVGKRVAKLRASHGESLREAAARTGVSHTTISRLEKGEVVGSLQRTVEKIAQGYNVPVDYLMSGKEMGRTTVLRRPFQVMLPTEDATPAQTRDAYARLLTKLTRSPVEPRVLEVIVDLLILQQEQQQGA